MMVFLFDIYGGITHNDLVDSNKKVAESFDLAKPIQSFSRTIQNAVEYADAGRTPFGVNQIIAQKYTHLFDGGVLLEACEKWNTRPLVEKGWNNLKIHFTRAHKTYRLTKNTAVGAGYNMANAATTALQQDTFEAIANLANAATTYKGMIDTLTKTNATLMAQIATLSEQVRRLNTTNQAPTSAPKAHVPGPAPWSQQG
jgi:hypothetical protein